MIRPHPRWDRLSFAAMRRLQARKLRRFLTRYVRPFSNYYRKLWNDRGLDPRHLKTVSDLARYPLTAKQDLYEHARDFILQPTPELIREHLPKRALLGILARKLLFGQTALKAALTREFSPTSVFFTTGRTSGPTPMFLTPMDEELVRVAGGRLVDVMDLVAPIDRGLSLFPFAPHLAFWQVVACGRARNILCLHSGGGRAMGSDGILRLLDRMKPTFLVGIPGFTAHLLRRATEEGSDLSSIRLVATGGDVLTHSLKKRIQGFLPKTAQVVSVYGFTESRNCWAECAPGTGFHTYPDIGLFEVIDPDTEEIVPAETTGELVYTGLGGRGSALVRYRTGDIAKGGITYAPCPECGRTLPRIAPVLSRRADGFANIKGTLVDLTALADAVRSMPHLLEWQGEITTDGDLELHVAMPDEDVPELVRRVRAAIEVRPAVYLVPLGKLIERLGLETQMKEVRVVDHRQASQEAKR